MLITEKICELVEEFNLIERSKKILRDELLNLDKSDIELLFDNFYDSNYLNKLVESIRLVTYGVDFNINEGMEKVKLSFDLFDEIGERSFIYYTFFDLNGEYLDSFFDYWFDVYMRIVFF